MADSGAGPLVAVAGLSVLAHDSICLHRAVLSLCRDGWAFAAPILLRTMLDALLSVAVITRSARPNVAAFKFLYAGARSALQDQEESAAVKAEARANIAAHRPQMTPEEQTEADSFLAERPRGPYWYSGDFRSPSDVAAQYAPTLSYLYKILSGTAHAGFLGMGLSRDDPARRDVNPRRDPRAEGFALFTSSRLLNEITLLRAEFEGLDAPEAAAVMRRLVAVRPVG